MTVFWIVAITLVVAALLFVVPPMFRRDEREELERREVNISVYKNQLSELEEDLAAGDVTQEHYDKSRLEIERRLLEDIAIVEKGVTKTSKGLSVGSSAFIAIGVPALAIGMYMDIGNLEGLDPDSYEQPIVGGDSPHGDGADIAMQIEAMVSQLAERLANNPQDIEGWVMLGRSLSVLGRYQEAVQAYEKAIQFVGEDPNILTDYADAIAMATGESLEGRPTQLLRKAISIDPTNQKALWLLGTALFERGDFVGAVEHWEHLQKLLPPGSEDTQAMASNIAEARAYRERQLAGEFGPAPEAMSLQDSLDGKTIEVSSASVSGTVSVSADLAQQFSKDDTLFIFAKAPTGPQMPLAIIRTTAGELPMEFNLDQTMAMMPNMSLANFNEVVVSARISKGQDAIAQSGDLQGESTVVAVGTSGLNIQIDSVIP